MNDFLMRRGLMNLDLAKESFSIDKAIEHLDDVTDKECKSLCCNAPIIAETFCFECMEHTEPNK